VGEDQSTSNWVSRAVTDTINGASGGWAFSGTTGADAALGEDEPAAFTATAWTLYTTEAHKPPTTAEVSAGDADTVTGAGAGQLAVVDPFAGVAVTE
jgi:hypothetical protein